ncbi:J domain-containing protein [Frateuria sp. MAH-13]|uniref:J domain-containing protein n=1 Tax=Frateuria flava TaxID=2821489 RepID=A0ABS4DNJ2_9GAMM|nr:J domain-containing protein [Frateuria flava]MBP1474613.1 J domain-containing protein [Frateuria flava]
MRSEWVVVLLGLVVGYGLVSFFMRGKVPAASARQPFRGPGQGPVWSDDRSESIDAQPWFDILGVPESASREEIEQGYRRRIGQYHPDKVARLGEDIQRLAEKRAKEINAAYDEAMRRLPR